MLNNLKILFEDNHIIAVDKNCGDLSQGDITGKKSLLDIIKEYIKKKCNKPGNVFLGLVHRLDKPVSGIIIFAKTSKAASRFHKIFLSRDINKFYIAIVNKIDPNKNWVKLENNIIKRKAFSEIIEKENKFSKKAVLQYKVISSFGDYSLLLISLETGRKHQIRTQLSHHNINIVGDVKYGGRYHTKDSIFLHSFYLAFNHPVGKEKIELITEYPDRFTEFFPDNGDISDLILRETKDFIGK